MDQQDAPRLIIVTGPVGGGKSSTALALAAALRQPGRDTAAIDMDLMYGFVRQQPGYGEPLAWERARRGAGALAAELLAAGMGAVIVDGEFFSAAELADLTARLPVDVARRFFTLRSGYATALARVAGDPSRGASKDPVFLKQLHDHFVRALPFLNAASEPIDTDALAIDEVVARLLAMLHSPDPPQRAHGTAGDAA